MREVGRLGQLRRVGVRALPQQARQQVAEGVRFQHAGLAMAYDEVKAGHVAAGKGARRQGGGGFQGQHVGLAQQAARVAAEREAAERALAAPDKEKLIALRAQVVALGDSVPALRSVKGLYHRVRINSALSALNSSIDAAIASL